jgi:hypothetical protein
VLLGTTAVVRLKSPLAHGCHSSGSGASAQGALVALADAVKAVPAAPPRLMPFAAVQQEADAAFVGMRQDSRQTQRT